MKPDIVINLFLNGENGHNSINCQKYNKDNWDLEDFDRAISLLQYGLRHCYKEKSKIYSIKKQLKSEIKKLTDS